MQTATPVQDRIRGCLLGGVIGDAFGAPLEGASQAGLQDLVARRAARPAPWGYTDDGAMLLACADALLLERTVEPTALLRALQAYYEPARGFGRGTKLALEAFESGARWDQCAFAAWREGSRGNGGAVRIAPVAIARWPDRQAFDRAVSLATRVTHAHAEAIEFAHLQATAIALILSDPGLAATPATFHAALVARLQPVPTQVQAKLDCVFALVGAGASPQLAARELGTSVAASESVPAALWSLVSEPASFSGAVTAAAALGGDVDSICCLVGALAGAMHGLTAIEPRWIANLAHEQPTAESIIELADRLHTLEPRAPHG